MRIFISCFSEALGIKIESLYSLLLRLKLVKRGCSETFSGKLFHKLFSDWYMLDTLYHVLYSHETEYFSTQLCHMPASFRSKHNFSVYDKVCPTCVSQKKVYEKVYQKMSRNNLSLLILLNCAPILYFLRFGCCKMCMFVLTSDKVLKIPIGSD